MSHISYDRIESITREWREKWKVTNHSHMFSLIVPSRLNLVFMSNLKYLRNIKKFKTFQFSVTQRNWIFLITIESVCIQNIFHVKVQYNCTKIKLSADNISRLLSRSRDWKKIFNIHSQNYFNSEFQFRVELQKILLKFSLGISHFVVWIVWVEINKLTMCCDLRSE